MSADLQNCARLLIPILGPGPPWAQADGARRAQWGVDKWQGTVATNTQA